MSRCPLPEAQLPVSFSPRRTCHQYLRSLKSPLTLASRPILSTQPPRNKTTRTYLGTLPRMLCEICLPIFQKAARDTPFQGDHQPNQASLAKSAAAACPICKDILQFILKWNTKGSTDFTLSPWYYRYYLHSAGIACLYFYCNWNPDLRIRYFLIGKRSIPTNLTIADRKGAIPLSESAGTVRKWLSTCSLQHFRCSKNVNPTSYPSRLLEVGKSGIRLVPTRQEKVHGPYVALSYCWGPPPHDFLRLTSSNMDHLQAGIQDEQLPVAFQGAISFIRLLNIRYIWIDCLCIIQDGPGSKEDWIQESSRMHQVYSECLLCLALDRAKSPQESILTGPTPVFSAPFDIKSKAACPRDGDNTASRVAVPQWYYDEAHCYQPLCLRAWAFQERFLSARVVGFGAAEVSWACRELQFACESFPAGAGELRNKGLGYSAISHPIFSDLDESSHLNELCRRWFLILPHYTSRSLTYPESDKLVALSAITKRMSQLMDDENLQGHFWKTIIRSLFWSCSRISLWPIQSEGSWRPTTRRNHLPRNENDSNLHVPPTWSWASIDGVVRFEEITHEVDDNRVRNWAEDLAHAVSYKVNSEAQDMGPNQLQSVTLKLKSFWIEGNLTADTALPRNLSNNSYSAEDQVFRTTMPDSVSHSIERFQVWVDDLDTISPPQGSQAIFFPLYLTKGASKDVATSDCDFVKGLFLKETKMVQDGLVVFERAGCGRIQFKDGIKWKDIAAKWDLEQREIMLG